MTNVEIQMSKEIRMTKHELVRSPFGDSSFVLRY